MRTRLLTAVATAFLGLASALTTANATTIGATGATGNFTSGHTSAGQSFLVDSVDTFLETFHIWIGGGAAGQTFFLNLSSSVNGSELFSSSFTVVGGENIITVNTNLTGGSTVWANIDYNGWNGQGVEFHSSDVYADGNAHYTGSQLTGFDQRFQAVFESTAAVPLPAAGFLLIGAVGGLAALRRKRG